MTILMLPGREPTKEDEYSRLNSGIKHDETRIRGGSVKRRKKNVRKEEMRKHES